MSAASPKRTVTLLALGQGLYVCSQTTLILLGGLVGYALSPDKALATVPVSAVILGVATTTIPASLYMRRVGRRAGFMTGAGFGILGGMVCALGLYLASFAVFCCGSFLMGCYNAFCGYYRFAAADAASESFRSKAISLVLAGGIVAAVIGPHLATLTRDVVAPYTYLGSYLMVAGLAALSLGLSSLLRMPPPGAAEQAASGRPLLEIMRQPIFLVAALSGMIAYGVMSLVMTATPLAMVACDYRDSDAAFIIQWHVLGMYAPSFFTGHLIGRLGLFPIMALGAAMLGACAVTALAGIALLNFWAGLVLLGVGWNFLFIGATTLLTRTYAPAERAKTQAANDFLVFAAMATASFLSGNLLHWFGWDGVNYGALPFVLLALLAIAWLGLFQRARQGRPA